MELLIYMKDFFFSKNKVYIYIYIYINKQTKRMIVYERLENNNKIK